MIVVQISFFKHLMKRNLNILLDWPNKILKCPFWKYIDKLYLKYNDKRVTDYAVDKPKTDGDIEVLNFTKYMPYILYLTFYKYEIEQIKNTLKDIQFLKYKAC